MELISGHDFLRLISALALVLALMGGLTLILRRINAAAGLQMPGNKRRLKIVEIMNLDQRRRLVLISRDGVEHLVILGAAGETVVETGIAPVEKNDDASAQP
ncbi:MAG: hypothetical protein JWO78_698 [Micavibrio sp.]|nr:hypothetical protein [Micavibrio sp.]